MPKIIPSKFFSAAMFCDMNDSFHTDFIYPSLKMIHQQKQCNNVRIIIFIITIRRYI